MLRKALWTLLGIGAALNLFSQNLTRSPYSAFGVGDLQFFGFTQQQSLGRLTQSYRSQQDYSIANPASLSALRYTIYQAGLNGSFGTIKNSTSSQPVHTAGLGYFSLGIPLTDTGRGISKGWGAAFGLLPYSAIGYNSYTRDIDTITGNHINQQSGSGGLNRFFMGMGKRITRNFSIGANASYLFGQLVTTDKVVFHPDTALLDYREDRTRFVRGFNFDAGFQFHDSIYIDTVKDVRWSMRVGGTYSFASNLNTRQQIYARTVYDYFGNDYRRDTILFNESLKGSLYIPQGYRVGIGFERLRRRDILFFGVEYYTQNWKNYTSFGQNANLADLHGFSAGVSYQPNKAYEGSDISKKYFSFVQYRAGIRYANTQIMHSNTQITEYGINFGLGFPVKPFKNSLVSYVNFGFEYNSRGVIKNDLIKENYYRFVLGFTLTDKWFTKYKYQ